MISIDRIHFESISLDLELYWYIMEHGSDKYLYDSAEFCRIVKETLDRLNIASLSGFDKSMSFKEFWNFALTHAGKNGELISDDLRPGELVNGSGWLNPFVNEASNVIEHGESVVNAMSYLIHLLDYLHMDEASDEYELFWKILG